MGKQVHLKEASMNIQVDVLIKAFSMRFGFWEGAPIYFMGAGYEATHDDLDKMVKIDPAKTPIYRTNLGFLSICNTTLIRGARNIVVDPGNFHVGFYGGLELRLRDFGLTPEDIDVVINTHGHHDHNQSNFVFRGKTLIWGEEQEEFVRSLYWPEYVEAVVKGIMGEVQAIKRADDLVEIDPGVYVMPTPGHTLGSISVLVDTGIERVAIIGDLAMTEEWSKARKFSHWYSPEQIELTNESLDKVAEWGPTLVIPGHGDPFRP